MGPYDNHRITLDPGLTALALRGLAEREGHYPFLDRVTRRRPRRGQRPRSAATAARSPARAPFWPRSLRAAELFPTFSRLRGLRGSSAAA
jgi:hypothetical protein